MFSKERRDNNQGSDDKLKLEWNGAGDDDLKEGLDVVVWFLLKVIEGKPKNYMLAVKLWWNMLQRRQQDCRYSAENVVCVMYFRM